MSDSVEAGAEVPDAAPRPARRGGEDGLKSLHKVVRILECFTVNRRSLSLVEICAATGFPRSTTHRLLASMREVGFVDQDRERDRYRLGLRLFEFGNVVLANLELHREGRAIVDSLHRLSGRTVHLAVFDGLHAVVIQRAETAGEIGLPSTYVENSPAYCTSVGKAILAFQDEATIRKVIEAGLERFTEATITEPKALRRELALTRDRGYAIDDGEHQPGVRCIGAPIRNQTGAVFAALSLSAPALQLPMAEVDDLSRIVLYHANTISQRLGFTR